jgi:hypothetical protein
VFGLWISANQQEVSVRHTVLQLRPGADKDVEALLQSEPADGEHIALRHARRKICCTRLIRNVVKADAVPYASNLRQTKHLARSIREST